MEGLEPVTTQEFQKKIVGEKSKAYLISDPCSINHNSWRMIPIFLVIKYPLLSRVEQPLTQFNNKLQHSISEQLPWFYHFKIPRNKQLASVLKTWFLITLGLRNLVPPLLICATTLSAARTMFRGLSPPSPWVSLQALPWRSISAPHLHPHRLSRLSSGQSSHTNGTRVARLGSLCLRGPAHMQTSVFQRLGVRNWSSCIPPRPFCYGRHRYLSMKRSSLGAPLLSPPPTTIWGFTREKEIPGDVQAGVGGYTQGAPRAGRYPRACDLRISASTSHWREIF